MMQSDMNIKTLHQQQREADRLMTGVIWFLMLVSFAKQMDLDRDTITKIGIGALLHDIGKTRTPIQILNKPGKLTEEEFVIMRQHVVHSREILEQTPGIHPVSLAVAAEHHERYDGSGYPEGKNGEEISLYGQIGIDNQDILIIVHGLLLSPLALPPSPSHLCKRTGCLTFSLSLSPILTPYRLQHLMPQA